MQSDIVTTTGIRADSFEQYNLRKQRRMGETIIELFLVFCGVASIFTTAGIVVVLSVTALDFFARPEVKILEFLTGIAWQPRINEFGIWPLLTMTMLIAVISVIVAVPIGLMIAIYLSEYASSRVRGALKPILEILAGIPTVVYGYFALSFVTPIVRNVFGTDTVEIYNVLSAGLVVGVLILPLVTSMSEDALHAVPTSLREAAYGLGARKLETSTSIVLPAATSGLVAAFIVAVSRAIGETMVVALAAGAGPRNFASWRQAFTDLALFNPFKAGETMTGHMVRISGGDLSYNSVDYESIFAIGLVLFVMTLTLNIIARRVVQRFREVYE
jgi:phosphate transport system permease protein